MSSFPPPSDRPDSIDRREALRRTALLLGGAISVPTVAAMLAGCETPAGDDAGWTPRALSAERAAMVAAIAEHIIPSTDTPGAREAGVHRFIDRMLAEYYSADDRKRFTDGLSDTDLRARETTGKEFLKLSTSEQRDILVALDAEAYRGAPVARPFFRTMKELTLLGYYTSQVGATRELKHVAIPGRFDGCVPFASIGRAWST